jgi:D-glycero-beta-D-manno-heptose-7-phosphate kinase
MQNKILVIGDSCRDVFIYCKTLRLCPDVPVPVLNILEQTENPGMARNVYRNIKNINGDCDILTNDNWYNITKTRYIDKNSNHMFFRVDSCDIIERIDLKNISFDYKIIVISDYDKGFLEKEDIEFIASNHNNVFLDTKKTLGDWAEKCRIIKINDFEYNKSKPFINDILESKIIHTAGAQGCFFNNKQFKVNKVEVKDSSGAGDSFMAALICNYIKTEDIVSSIKFANICASKVVQKKGVTVIEDV